MIFWIQFRKMWLVTYARDVTYYATNFFRGVIVKANNFGKFDFEI